MAYDIGPKIGIEGEAEFRKQIRDINSSLKTMATEMTAVQSSFEGEEKSVRSLTAQKEVLNKQIDTQTQKLKLLQEGLEESRKKYGKNSEVTQGWQRSVNQATTDLNKMKAQLAQVNQDLEKAGKKTDDFGKQLQESGKHITQFGDKIEKAGKKVGELGEKLSKGITVPLTAAGTALVATSENISNAMSVIENNLGVTGDEAEKYKKILEDTAETGVGGFDEIAGSIVPVVQNMKDIPDERLANTTEKAMQLANVFQEDVTEVTRAAGAMMKQFGIDGDTALDLIARGYQKGLNFSGEFLDTLNEYSVHFKSLGFSAEDMFNILIKGADEGAWNLDKIGDAIKEGNIRFKDLSDSSKDAFKSLGLNANQMFKDFAAGGDKAKLAFMTVTGALAGIENETKRNEIGVALFGTQYEDLEKTVVASFANITDELGNYEGAADEVAEKNKTLKQEMQGLWNSLQKDIAPLGKKMVDMLYKAEPAIKNTVNGVGDLVDGFADLKPETQEMIIKLAGVTAAAGPVTKVVGSLTSGVGGLIKKIGNLTVSLGKKGAAQELETAATAGTGLAKALAAIPGPAKLALVAGAALGVGIAAAVKHARNEAEKADLAKHFGDVKLSMEEVEEVANHITNTPWLVKVQTYLDAKKDLTAYQEALTETVKDMNKMDWKVSIGMELTEEEESNYKQAIESFVSNAKEYVMQKQYNVSMALQIALDPDESSYIGLSDFANTYYGGANEKLNELGVKLADLVNESFENNTFAQNRIEIEKIRAQMNEVVQEISEQDFAANLSNFRLALNSMDLDLDADSFQQVNEKINEQIDEMIKGAEDANKEAFVIINTRYDAMIEAGIGKNVAEKIREQAEQEIEENMADRKTEVVLQGLEFSLGRITLNYEDELQNAIPKFQQDLENEIRTSLDDGMKTGRWDLNWTVLEQDLEKGSSELSKATKANIKKLLQSMEPQKETLEALAQSYTEMGKVVPESISNGLTDIYNLEAMTGNVDSLWKFVGTSISDSDEMKRMLEEAYKAGDQVPYQIAEAIKMKTGEVYNAATGTWEAVSQASFDVSESLLKQLNSGAVDCSDATIQGLISQYGFIQEAASGQWIQIRDAAVENIDEVKQTLQSCGYTASDGLAQSIADKSQDVKIQALEMINQLKYVSDDKKAEIVGKLMELGIAADDSLGDGLYNNVGFVWDAATNAIDVVNTATGKRIGEVTPEFVQSMKDMGLEGVAGMEDVLENSSVSPPEVEEISTKPVKEWVWQTENILKKTTFQVGIGVATSGIIGGATKHASGGIFQTPHMALVAEEAPGEAIIPLSVARRASAIALWEQTGMRLGILERSIPSTISMGMQGNLTELGRNGADNTRNSGGITINLAIDRFENNSDRDLDSLVEYVSDALQLQQERRGRVFG